MSIIRTVHNKENPYVMINKASLWDKNLSLDAVGLWARLLSRPDDWTVSVAEITKSCGIGPKKCYQLLRELEAAGYAYRCQERVDSTKSKKKKTFSKMETYVFETKVTPEEIKKMFPLGHYRHADNPLSGNGHTTNTDSTNTSSSLRSEEKENKRKSAAPPPSAEASDLFDIFFRQIKERCPNFKKPQEENWAREFDAMIVNDKRHPIDIAEVCRWVHTHSFWKANILSPSSLRKNFDKISMQMKSSAELDLQENNRRFAIDLKKKYPDRLKNLTINPKYVININTGKDLLYTLPEETFRHTLCHMFGGTYEPNRSAEQRSEVETDPTD